jgi:hypothetical protein
MLVMMIKACREIQLGDHHSSNTRDRVFQIVNFLRAIVNGRSLLYAFVA